MTTLRSLWDAGYLTTYEIAMELGMEEADVAREVSAYVSRKARARATESHQGPNTSFRQHPPPETYEAAHAPAMGD